MTIQIEPSRRSAAAAARIVAACFLTVSPALVLPLLVLPPMSSAAAEPPAMPPGGATNAPSSPVPGTTVTGSVGMRERLALRPGFELIVKLLDVSRADAPAVVLAEQVISLGTRQLPVPFALAYDPARIEPSHSYMVQARVEFHGQLAFITDQQYPVITRGAPSHVDVVVKRVPRKDRH